MRFLSFVIAATLAAALKAPCPAYAQTEKPGYSEAEQKLLDKTLGGAIAPQDQEDLDDLKGHAGAASDRLANDAVVDDSAAAQDAIRKSNPKAARPRLTGARRNIVKNENPYAPQKLLSNNKVSFGAAPKITYIPGFGPDAPVLTADDIKILAALSRNRVNISRLTPKMEEEYGLPAGTAEAINNIRSPRIDGMLPSEFAVKATVDSIMSLVAQRPEGDARKRAAEAAYSRLSGMADGVRQLNSVPKDIYSTMGVGDAYMKDQKEGYSNGLGRLQEALEALDKIRNGEDEETP